MVINELCCLKLMNIKSIKYYSGLWILFSNMWDFVPFRNEGCGINIALELVQFYVGWLGGWLRLPCLAFLFIQCSSSFRDPQVPPQWDLEGSLSDKGINPIAHNFRGFSESYGIPSVPLPHSNFLNEEVEKLLLCHCDRT